MPREHRWHPHVRQIICFYVGMTMILLFTLGQVKVTDGPDDQSPWWNPFWRMPDGKHLGIRGVRCRLHRPNGGGVRSARSVAQIAIVASLAFY